MPRLARRSVLAATLATATVMLATPASAAKDPIYTGRFSDLALGGYDPVAYFTLGRPTEGSRRFASSWNGATWRFVSAEHKALFDADPTRYAPQYGGYCAYAVSEGYTASADPTAWRIVDGKLYVNYSHDVQKQWEQDIPGRITRADGHWPAVLEK
jgi:YHS domain-containing protein